jgi:hypothetical protein
LAFRIIAATSAARGHFGARGVRDFILIIHQEQLLLP